MRSQVTKFTDRSSDRRVLFATILSVLTALLTLLIEILNQFHVVERHKLPPWAELGAEILCVASIAWAGTLALRVMNARRVAGLVAIESRNQVEALFNMTDMLQSALNYTDANAVMSIDGRHAPARFRRRAICFQQ